jgi:hypothetical protein
LKLFQEWERRVKKNEGRGEFNYNSLRIIRTFVNVTLYPQYNNNKIE